MFPSLSYCPSHSLTHSPTYSFPPFLPILTPPYSPTEQKHLDTEINNLRNGLRSKVNKLNDLEHKDPTLGTNLKALSQEEWQAVSQVLGK